MAYTTITDPSAYFQTALYTGNGGSNTITNDGNSNLQPDWLWIKARNSVQNHQLHDSSRGASKGLNSNNNNAEYTDANAVTGFTSDGFTMNNNYGSHNASGNTYVAWQWAANGGTTATNTDGSQNSTVQVNSTAGFSIVKRTGTGSAGATYGHGLGAVPDVIINKALNINEWYSYFKAIGGGTHWIDLSGTGAAVADANMWNNTDATSSVFTVGNSGGSNGSGVEYISYCFKSVQGYSKFGSYTGNGSADGPMVYCGFKPAWVMIKRTDVSDMWYIKDNATSPNNPAINTLFADLSNATNTNANAYVDFVSNGIKVRGNDAGINASGGTFIYMAFAESPFTTSDGVPTTAR